MKLAMKRNKGTTHVTQHETMSGVNQETHSTKHTTKN